MSPAQNARPIRETKGTRSGEASSSSFADREFRFTDEDFEFLRSLIKARTGIELGEHKQEMVYGRLARRLRALGLDGFEAYCRFLDGAEGENELLAMVNAITTNLTKFFREKHHFDYLSQTLLPEIAARQTAGGKRRLRIWSAGCSSGEEPYSIAMSVLASVSDIERWDAKMLATDLDTEMVSRGAAGRYPQRVLESIPAEHRRRFRLRDDGDSFQMDDALKNFIVFKPLNLLEPWPMRGPFDIIFCRNVVIYFDRPTRATLFDRYADMLADDGVLFIGHSESLLGLTDRFQLVGQTIYRKTQ